MGLLNTYLFCVCRANTHARLYGVQTAKKLYANESNKAGEWYRIIAHHRVCLEIEMEWTQHNRWTSMLLVFPNRCVFFSHIDAFWDSKDTAGNMRECSVTWNHFHRNNQCSTLQGRGRTAYRGGHHFAEHRLPANNIYILPVDLQKYLMCESFRCSVIVSALGIFSALKNVMQHVFQHMQQSMAFRSGSIRSATPVNILNF